jgi:hypothetical protein
MILHFTMADVEYEAGKLSGGEVKIKTLGEELVLPDGSMENTTITTTPFGPIRVDRHVYMDRQSICRTYIAIPGRSLHSPQYPAEPIALMEVGSERSCDDADTLAAVKDVSLCLALFVATSRMTREQVEALYPAVSSRGRQSSLMFINIQKTYRLSDEDFGELQDNLWNRPMLATYGKARAIGLSNDRAIDIAMIGQELRTGTLERPENSVVMDSPGSKLLKRCPAPPHKGKLSPVTGFLRMHGLV